jgi:hypothetical protein
MSSRWWPSAIFVAAGALWIVLLGWVIHLWSVVDAARWKPPVAA